MASNKIILFGAEKKCHSPAQDEETNKQKKIQVPSLLSITQIPEVYMQGNKTKENVSSKCPCFALVFMFRSDFYTIISRAVRLRYVGFQLHSKHSFLI